MRAADPGAKAIVFSQFTAMLDLIHFRLEQVRFRLPAAACACKCALPWAPTHVTDDNRRMVNCTPSVVSSSSSWKNSPEVCECERVTHP